MIDLHILRLGRRIPSGAISLILSETTVGVKTDYILERGIKKGG